MNYGSYGKVSLGEAGMTGRPEGTENLSKGAKAKRAWSLLSPVEQMKRTIGVPEGPVVKTSSSGLEAVVSFFVQPDDDPSSFLPKLTIAGWTTLLGGTTALAYYLTKDKM